MTKRWKQPKCPLMEKWLNEMWHNTKVHYSAFKKAGILIYATRWMNLENIILSESQTQNLAYYIFFYEMSTIGQLIEMDAISVAARVKGCRKQGVTAGG